MKELTYDATSRLVTTRRWRIHVNEAGSGEVVILLHGSGPGATSWSNFAGSIPALAADHRVIAADLPGWGESDPVTWRDRDHPGAVLDLMDALDIERATLIGNSMGGGTAIRFGYQHPERVGRLITMGASSGAPTLFGAAGLTEGLKVLQEGYRDPTPATMRRLVEIMTFDHSFVTDDLVNRRADTVAAHPAHNANFLDGVGKRPVVELDLARVATITAPTLLCHGRDDRVVSFEHSLRLVSLIPDARLMLLNRCGHWLQIEHATEFTQMVLAFLG